MQIENEPEKPQVEKDTRSDVARTWQMIGNTELVEGSPRQIVDGGLLGVCIAIFIALMTVQQKDIDTNLEAALIAIAIAMPVLAFGFLCTFYKRPKIVPHAGSSNLFSAMLAGAWIAEGMGWLAAYIGIACVLRHINLSAFIAFLSASGFILLILPILSAIGLAIYAVRLFKKQGKAQQKTDSAASGDVPVNP